MDIYQKFNIQSLKERRLKYMEMTRKKKMHEGDYTSTDGYSYSRLNYLQKNKKSFTLNCGYGKGYSTN